MRRNKSRADQLLSEIQLNISCPPATQSIEINLKNRQKCVDIANYGPANPDIENEFYSDFHLNSELEGKKLIDALTYNLIVNGIYSGVKI